MRARISPSLAISVLALFVALSGTAMASSYLITKTSQIKPSVRHALKGQDGSRGPAGAPGPAGAAGPAGPVGTTGATGPSGIANLATVDSSHVSVPSGGNATFTATCPSGSKVLGTGFYSSIATVGFVKNYGQFVGGIMFNNTGVTANDLHVQAICAQVSAGAVAASVRVSRPRTNSSSRTQGRPSS
jgi:hypothetical protein